MKFFLTVAAAIAALASAVFWFWSARMRVTYAAFGTYNGPAPMVLQQLAVQARLNRWAALATGISVLLQAAAGFVSG